MLPVPILGRVCLAGRSRCGRCVPEFRQEFEHLRVVFRELLSVEGEEVIRREERFGGLGEILHRSGHGVGPHGCRTPVAESLLDPFVEAGRFDFLEGGFDLGVPETLFEHSVVIGMREFVQREVRHAFGLALEGADVGEFDCLLHRRVAFVLAQPASTGVILGTRLHLWVFGRKPERNLPQFHNRRSRDDAINLLKLNR